MDTGDDDNLPCVAWSADGKYLYAGGQACKMVDGIWRFFIRRWDTGRWNSMRDFLTLNDNTITGIEPLPSGGLVWSGLDPAWGILQANGAPRHTHLPQTADYRDNEHGLPVSADGQSVGFGY